jgi:hypothetical protein
VRPRLRTKTGVYPQPLAVRRRDLRRQAAEYRQMLQYQRTPAHITHKITHKISCGMLTRRGLYLGYAPTRTV